MNKDKKAKNSRRNNNFAAAFDYLKRNTDIHTQQELADRMGVSKDTISRIITAKTDVTEDAITKFQTATDCIFNLQWLRGESDVMLMSNLTSPVSRDGNGQTPMYVPDYNTMMDFNTKIAIKDEQIEELKRVILKNETTAKRELAAKEETISALREQLNGKDAQLADKQVIIDSLQDYINDLKRQLSAYRTNEEIGSYPFKMGAADDGDRPSARK